MFFDALYLKNYAFTIPIDWWTGHTWTLCIEQQFYLIWPVVLVAGGWLLGWRFAVGCIVLEPAIRVVAYVMFPAYRSFIDIMLPTRIDMLMFGWLLAIACARKPTLVTRFSGVVAGLGLTVRYHGLYAFTAGYTITGVACAVAVLYVVRFPASTLARILSLPPIVWLGQVSYSLILAAVVMASASYYIVESRFFTPKPIQRPQLSEAAP